jgi:hypothetical protein
MPHTEEFMELVKILIQDSSESRTSWVRMKLTHLDLKISRKLAELHIQGSKDWGAYGMRVNIYN